MTHENVTIAKYFGGESIITLRLKIANTANLLRINRVESDSDMRELNDIAKQCKSGIDYISKIRKDYTRKLDAEKKEIMAQERELIAPLEYTLDRCKELQNAYLREVEAKREAAKRIAEERYAKQMAMTQDVIEAQERGEDITERLNDIEDFANEQLPAEMAKALTPMEGVKTRTTWDYKVVSLDNIPRQFLTVDHTAIKAEIQRIKKSGIAIEDVNIPGVEVFAKTTTVIS